MNLNIIKKDMETVIDELLKASNLKEGDSVVLGGSTSEVIGKSLGSATNLDVSNTIIETFVTKMKDNNLNPIIQACEHINRALVVEKSYSDKFDIMPINVIPIESAGGGFATSAMDILEEPVVIEKAKRVSAGIDIGDVFIGMHLDCDRVGVVVRSDIKKIGEANLSMIRTRAKLIGGDRSKHF